MPWNEMSPMDQKTLFIADYRRQIFSMAELCRRFGVSRKTGYKWIERYEAEGAPGLLDRSRRPHTCPHQTEPDIVEEILAARLRHPTWGAKKLLAILERRHPSWSWPARSTVCDILKREGMIESTSREVFHAIRHPPTSTTTATSMSSFPQREPSVCTKMTAVSSSIERRNGGCWPRPRIPGAGAGRTTTAMGISIYSSVEATAPATACQARQPFRTACFVTT